MDFSHVACLVQEIVLSRYESSLKSDQIKLLNAASHSGFLFHFFYTLAVEARDKVKRIVFRNFYLTFYDEYLLTYFLLHYILRCEVKVFVIVVKHLYFHSDKQMLDIKLQPSHSDQKHHNFK